MTAHDEQLIDLTAKLLMATGDTQRRSRYWKDAQEAIKPREREYFAGRLLGAVLASFDGVIASHPQGEHIISQLRAKSDTNDFQALTEQFDNKEK